MSRGRRPRGRTIALLLIGVVLLGSAVWLVYFSQFLVARRVAVAGERQLQSDQIVAAAQVPMGIPLALQDVDAIARRATTLPAVHAASVSRTWPDTITVTVTERRPVLAVPQPDGFALVDNEGVAYAVSATLPAGVMLAEVNPSDRLLLQQVGSVAAALPGNLSRKVTALAATNTEQISLRLKSGVTVNWGNAVDSPLKADIVAALLKKNRRSAAIDVSSPHNPATH